MMLTGISLNQQKTYYRFRNKDKRKSGPFGLPATVFGVGLEDVFFYEEEKDGPETEE